MTTRPPGTIRPWKSGGGRARRPSRGLHPVLRVGGVHPRPGVLRSRPAGPGARSSRGVYASAERQRRNDRTELSPNGSSELRGGGQGGGNRGGHADLPGRGVGVPQDQSAQDAIQAAYDALVQPGSGRAPSATLTGVIGSYLTQGVARWLWPARSCWRCRSGMRLPRRHPGPRDRDRLDRGW